MVWRTNQNKTKAWRKEHMEVKKPDLELQDYGQISSEFD